MLSRTAANLFWMARYVERAENLARLLDVAFRLSLLPLEAEEGVEAWRQGLAIADDDRLFAERHGAVTPDSVVNFLGLDRDNPSSIVSSLRKARENARASRTTVTGEMWEALNDTWLGLARFDAEHLADNGCRVFLEWVRERSHLFRGVTSGTMPHDEAFWFTRLGTFLERADNTARLLTFKAEALARPTNAANSEVEYYQWASLLRSLGAFRAYHRAFRDQVRPRKVAELLILRPEMPRSLRHCQDHVLNFLTALNAAEDGVLGDARTLRAGLSADGLDRALETGIERFLDDFMARNAALAAVIEREFMLVG